MARTGSKVNRVLRFSLKRRGLLHGLREQTAAVQQRKRGAIYRFCAKQAMRTSGSAIISISMDATRVGGINTMFAALYAAEPQTTCWGDPMVSFEKILKTTN